MPPTTPQDHKSKQSKKRTPRKTAATPISVPIDPEPDALAAGVMSDKYAVTAWGNAVGSEMTDFTTPSGQTCLVRRPGVEQLLVEGVLFEADYLTSLVQDNLNRVERGLPEKEITVEELMKDPKQFAAIVATVDRIVCAVVVKPAVKRPPNDITLRVIGQVYTDTIDLVDRFALLDFALGGSRALASFRDGSTPGVGSVRAVESDAAGA